ncbi:hypothetical protein MTYP_02621 [Methylophilaceae bacterium]|nr:hypothetical protein MTYP_02621 [Methylophilaceae bacterium]
MRYSKSVAGHTLQGFFALFFLAAFMAVAQAAETGLLWKLEAPGGKTSYLYGTMHSDDPRVTDFPAPVIKALLDSDVFMMETLPPANPSIFLMEDGRLDQLLSEQEFVQVVKLADFHSMHTDIAALMKPWLLAVIFDLPKPQTPYTQDALLMSLAQGKSKPVRGLETTEEHFGALDSFTIEEQLVMLRSVLKRSAGEKERNFEAMVKAYLSADPENIEKLNDRITGSILPRELWGRMRSKLLDERNILMADRIARQADQAGIFIAVGASHLPGKGGLIARLRSAGYKVTPVN